MVLNVSKKLESLSPFFKASSIPVINLPILAVIVRKPPELFPIVPIKSPSTPITPPITCLIIENMEKKPLNVSFSFSAVSEPILILAANSLN